MRLVPLLAIVVGFVVAGCSGDDDGPNRVTRIDGPAQVDDDGGVAPGGDVDE